MMKRIKLLLIAFALCVSCVSWAGVDINQADVQTLAENLKGVGAKKAQAIVDYRVAHGRFSSADDLAMVKGISVKTIEKNRQNIDISKK